MAAPICDFQFSDHAVFEMRRRGLSVSVARTVLLGPEQRFQVRAGREVLQSLVSFDGKPYLVRVFVDVDRNPARVVTVCRTSNIEKYRRAER